MWTDNIVKVMQANKGLVDGVFCDRSGSIEAVLEKDLFCYEFEEGHMRSWDVGHWQTVANTMAALSPLTPTAIVIGNHAEAVQQMNLTNGSTWNGKMFEHFVPVRDYVPSGDQLAALRHAGRSPTSLITEVHVDFCSYGNAMYNRSLAAFLIGASDYDYYACTEGWGFAKGWDKWSADYDRPLGVPLGTANRSKEGVWYRAFASGTAVWLDTKSQTAWSWGKSCIKWADGHVTSSGEAGVCDNLRLSSLHVIIQMSV